jgi:peptidoglycan/LPS O-acetylase OafA/YrhL
MIGSMIPALAPADVAPHTSSAPPHAWRLPAIDGLRCMAMYLVYTYHMWMFAGKPTFFLSLGSIRIDLLSMFGTFPSGVDLFMVLSGFCLFLPLLKSPAALERWQAKNFFKRRVKRLCPAYYASMVYAVALPLSLVALLKLCHIAAHWPQLPSWRQVITHCLFVHTFFVDTWAGFCGPLWSLGVEAQFYLLFPLAIWLYKRFGRGAFAIIVISSVVYQIVTTLILGQQKDWCVNFIWSVNFLGRWMDFGLGMFAASVFARCAHSGKKGSAVAGSVGVCLAVVLYAVACNWTPLQLSWFPTTGLLLGATFTLLCISICATETPFSRIFSSRPLALLGYISYSIYVIHQDTAWYISEFCKRFLHLQGVPLFVVLCTLGFAIVVAISFLFFRLFEKPFLEDAKYRKSVADTGNVLDK